MQVYLEPKKYISATLSISKDTCKGFLLKKAQNAKIWTLIECWNKRYFLLDNRSQVLYIYKTNDVKTLYCTIKYSDILEVCDYYDIKQEVQ